MVIQDFGPGAREDLNQVDLEGDERESAGEEGGVEGSVETD